MLTPLLYHAVNILKQPQNEYFITVQQFNLIFVNLNDHAKQGKAVFVAKVTINKGSTPGAGNLSQSN